ncbi:hypothetical protein H9Q69_005445 [Fusarium xylarioides]|nr:hypothetical protein H9Q69_005445 [Fusarium xylarioides]
MKKRKSIFSEFTHWSDDSESDDEAKKPVKRSRRDKNTQTSTDPDPTPDEDTISDPETVENAPDPGPSQPESSEDTISDAGDPDTNATTVEEPAENAPDPGPSQAGSSGTQNTGSGQGRPICNRSGCTRPRESRFGTCDNCLAYNRAYGR